MLCLSCVYTWTDYDSINDHIWNHRFWWTNSFTHKLTNSLTKSRMEAGTLPKNTGTLSLAKNLDSWSPPRLEKRKQFCQDLVTFKCPLFFISVSCLTLVLGQKYFFQMKWWCNKFYTIREIQLLPHNHLVFIILGFRIGMGSGDSGRSKTNVKLWLEP